MVFPLLGVDNKDQREAISKSFNGAAPDEVSLRSYALFVWYTCDTVEQRKIKFSRYINLVDEQNVPPMGFPVIQASAIFTEDDELNAWGKWKNEMVREATHAENAWQAVRDRKLTGIPG